MRLIAFIGVHVLILLQLCDSISARPDSIRGSISLHRRAMSSSEEALKKRASPSKPFLEDRSATDDVRRRGSDDGSGDGNIATMIELVNAMAKMNQDWQDASNKALQEGKTPTEEKSTDQMIKEITAQGDGGGDDYGSTSGQNTTSSSDNDQKTKKKESSSSNNDQSKSTDTQKQKQQDDDAAAAAAAKKAAQEKKQKEQQAQKEKDQEAAKQKQQQEQEQEQQKEKEQQQEQPKKKQQPQQQQQKSASSSSKPSSGLFKGDMTFFDVGLNACGWTDKDSDYIVAASAILWQQFGGDQSNGNPICNRRVRIYKNGKVMEAKVTDQCPPCKKYSLDMSPSLFKYFEDPDVGRTDVEWEWCD